MNPAIALKIYAVEYNGEFISRVKAIRCDQQSDPQHVELTRTDMLKAAKVGAALEVVSDASPDSRNWGNVAVVNIDGSTYITVHQAATAIDDLGDCAQLAD